MWYRSYHSLMTKYSKYQAEAVIVLHHIQVWIYTDNKLFVKSNGNFLRKHKKEYIKDIISAAYEYAVLYFKLDYYPINTKDEDIMEALFLSCNQDQDLFAKKWNELHEELALFMNSFYLSQQFISVQLRYKTQIKQSIFIPQS